MMNKEAIKFILAIKLKELRLSQGLSLTDLAQKSQLSVSYLNEIEKAKKFPKPEKLVTLAQALNIEYNELVSTEVSPKIKPIVDFFEKNFFHHLPLKEFGISETDLFDMISYDPGKFSSFLTTMMELLRNYDVEFTSINQAALKSYQISNNNYFPDIEEKVNEFLTSFNNNSPQKKGLNSHDLREILCRQFNYVIDEETLNKYPLLKETRAVFKKGPPHKLLLNNQLSEEQKLFILAKELGNVLLDQHREEVQCSDLPVSTFTDVLKGFRSSYFAGALLIPRKNIVDDLSEFFQNKIFRPKQLEKIMSSYRTSSEVFLHRLSQILPQYFGLNQLFFLRSHHDIKNDTYNISKEMHLSRLHSPHATFLGENYCQRWITISLLKTYKEQMKSQKQIISAQRSIMLDTNEEYFCFSIAAPSMLKEGINSCITIGLLNNPQLKKVIQFAEAKNIPLKPVGQTCERCKLTDCTERIAEASVYLQNQKLKKQKQAILKIVNHL